MTVKNDNDNTPKLKNKDKELLEQLDKSIKLQDKLADISYYYKHRADNEMIKELQLRPFMFIVVNDIDTLLYKYEYYCPSIENNIFYFNKPIPVSAFMQFRKDIEIFNFKDIIINTTNDRWGYIKWKM